MVICDPNKDNMTLFYIISKGDSSRNIENKSRIQKCSVEEDFSND